MRIFLVIELMFLACSDNDALDEYIAIHESAATRVPIARQMEEMFAPADHFITHYGMGEGVKVWNTQCFLNDRYVLTMQVDVEIDYSQLTVSQVGEPQLWLRYVEEYSESEGAAFDPSKEVQFDATQWQEIYEAGGDFQEIDVALETTAATGMQEYIMARRTPLIAVQLINEEAEDSDGDDQ